ncbi:hypothetical protein F2Q68_00005188 [Brassica cretica]|uniref:Uncharacterized protein n=1 Tax=Brassica cretica TaxID=69181 RepID=A0A8S9JGU0_BRACR|nr:hypothetical protein F2Q68_00005188 [Brassica cretica]
MDLEGRLMYHCKAGPVKVETNPLHMVASRDSFGSATASILWWLAIEARAMGCSSGLRRSPPFCGLGHGGSRTRDQEHWSAPVLRRRGERFLAMWILPSILPSRSAGSGICPGFCSQSPWLVLERVSRLARLGTGCLPWSCTGIWSAPYRAGYVASEGFRPMLEDFVETIRGFLQVPAAGELFYELVAENSKGGYGPGG